MSPWDSLPEHLNSPEKWKGTDLDNWAQRWTLKLRGLISFGPRSKHKWAQWQAPVVILGSGIERWEHLKSNDLYLPLSTRRLDTFKTTEVLREDGYFPSIIQYWSRAHFLLTYAPGSFGLGWHVSFHWFWPWSQPAYYPTQTNYTIKQMFSFRFGARYDKDNIHTFPAVAIGGDFV